MVATIADIPFRQAPPDDLLGIGWGRPRFVDDDHTGFGWGLVPRLSLVSTASPPSRTPHTHDLTAPLVLALHSATREPGSTAPFDLELVVDGERLHLPLERFLAVWLPKLVTASREADPGRLPAAQDIVLALCNPTDYPLGPITRPILPPGTRGWVALGDVDSSAQHTPQHGTTWHLTARHWTAL